MIEIFIKILPIVLLFFLGVFLRFIDLFKLEHADVFIKLVFYIAVPALIINALGNAKIEMEYLLYPVISSSIILINGTISYFIGKALKLSDVQLGPFIIAAMILNVGFLLPFVIAIFGNEGLAMLTIFDLGNLMLVFTVIYFIACKYNPTIKNKKGVLLKKVLLTPAIWALFVALGLNVGGVEITGQAYEFFDLLGSMTIPLVMLALGVYFNPRVVNLKPMIIVIFIKMGLGLALAYMFINIFDLSDLAEKIALLVGATPIGYNTLTFSTMENLDKKFAASLVSFSVLLAIILFPILIIIIS